MSSSALKISGKSVALPESSQLKWKFTRRPGGWILAESENGLRRKLMLTEVRGVISWSLKGRLGWGDWVHSTREVSGKEGADDLTAQFPGKIRKILVKAGDKVASGDTLLLVEAMKMEFTIRAPFAGHLKALLVVEGQQISAGDRFVDLEEVPSGK